jgi:hypothetical protein
MLCARSCCVLQEPHKHQVEWLAGQLPEYAWVGKGRCPVVFGIGEEVRLLLLLPQRCTAEL